MGRGAGAPPLGGRVEAIGGAAGGGGWRAVSYGLRENRLHVRGVHAGDDITVIVDLREEPAEGIPQVVERAVHVEGVRLYVGHDGDVRPQAQERCADLARLDTEMVGVAGRGVSADIAALAA